MRSNISERDLVEVRSLVAQLSSSALPLKKTAFRKVLADHAVHILGIREKGKLVAIGTLVLIHSIVGIRGRLEDIVVDEAQRGKGLGEKLSRMLIARARALKCASLELSSRPSRVAANALYQKLGFEKKETNVYKLLLPQKTL